MTDLLQLYEQATHQNEPRDLRQTLGPMLDGLSRSLGPSSLRFAGMVLTWIALVVGIAGVLWFVFIPQQNLVQSP